MGIDFKGLIGQDKDKEERKRQRKRERRAKKLLKETKEQIETKTSELDRLRAEAKKFLATGQKGAATQSLQAYRNTLGLIQKLRVRLLVFETLKDKLQMAQADQESVNILNEFANALEIDPEDIADKLEEVEDKVEEQEAVDEILDKVYQQQMAGADKVSDAIPSIEELMSDLEAEVDDGNTQDEASNSKEKSEEIGRLRDELEDLENGDEK